MFGVERIEDWRGAELVDPEGERIGKLEEVFATGEDAEPALGTVKTGTFRSKHRLFPLEGTTLGRDYVRVRWTKDRIKDGPVAEDPDAVSTAEAMEAFGHYGVSGTAGAAYESASARERRRSEAEAAERRAAELEKQAELEAERARSKEAEAESLKGSVSAAEERRREALAEAARLRGEKPEREDDAGITDPRPRDSADPSAP